MADFVELGFTTLIVTYPPGDLRSRARRRKYEALAASPLARIREIHRIADMNAYELQRPEAPGRETGRAKGEEPQPDLE